jgi:ubiE/COQ5 methyltransferase family
VKHYCAFVVDVRSMCIIYQLRGLWHTALTVAVLVQSCKCLYFAQVPNDLLRKVYDTYSFNVIPKVGEVVANDKAAYQVSTAAN